MEITCLIFWQDEQRKYSFPFVDSSLTPVQVTVLDQYRQVCRASQRVPKCAKFDIYESLGIQIQTTLRMEKYQILIFGSLLILVRSHILEFSHKRIPFTREFSQ